MNKYCDSLEDAVEIYKDAVEKSPYCEPSNPIVDLKHQNLIFLMSIVGVEIPMKYEPVQDAFGGGEVEYDTISSYPLLECCDRLKNIMSIYALDKLDPFLIELKVLEGNGGYNFSKYKFKDESETPKDHILNIYHILEEIDDPYSMVDFARVSCRIMQCIEKETPSYCKTFLPKTIASFMAIYGEYDNGKYKIDETFMNKMASHYGNGGIKNGYK